RGPVLRPQLAVHERRDTPAHRLLQRGLHPRRSGDRPVRGSRPGLRAVEHHALRRPAPCLRVWIPGHRETVRRRLCRRRLWQQRGGRVHRDQLSVLGLARSHTLKGVSMARWHQALVALAVLAVYPTMAWSQTGTVAGDFWVEPATLVALGFEWRI